MSGDGKQLTYICERGAKNGINEKLSFKRSEKTKDVSLVFDIASNKTIGLYSLEDCWVVL